MRLLQDLVDQLLLLAEQLVQPVQNDELRQLSPQSRSAILTNFAKAASNSAALRTSSCVSLSRGNFPSFIFSFASFFALPPRAFGRVWRQAARNL